MLGSEVTRCQTTLPGTAGPATERLAGYRTARALDSPRHSSGFKKRGVSVAANQFWPGPPRVLASKSPAIHNDAAEPSEAATSGRKIVFAVDGTADAEEGLRWLVKHVARKGTRWT